MESTAKADLKNADVYHVMDVQNERRVATICVTEDKSHWEIQSDLGIETEDELITFIKSQSPLT